MCAIPFHKYKAQAPELLAVCRCSQVTSGIDNHLKAIFRLRLLRCLFVLHNTPKRNTRIILKIKFIVKQKTLKLKIFLYFFTTTTTYSVSHKLTPQHANIYIIYGTRTRARNLIKKSQKFKKICKTLQNFQHKL